ncbi:MAG: hypothetical protein ACRCYO_12975 [Bacteroidia bacterium]
MDISKSRTKVIITLTSVSLLVAIVLYQSGGWRAFSTNLISTDKQTTNQQDVNDRQRQTQTLVERNFVLAKYYERASCCKAFPTK